MHATPPPLRRANTSSYGGASYWIRTGDAAAARLHHLSALVAAGLLAAAIAGVVLIPAAEFISRTTYAGTRPVERVANDGYLTLLSWLRPAAGVGALEGGQVSVGVAALVLAAISPVLLRQDPAGRAALRSWGAIAATSIRHPHIIEVLDMGRAPLARDPGVEAVVREEWGEGAGPEAEFLGDGVAGLLVP